MSCVIESLFGMEIYYSSTAGELSQDHKIVLRRKENKLDYRPEIDGLRAVAVVAVLFYHAGFKRFTGGFVGVDVFFCNQRVPDYPHHHK